MKKNTRKDLVLSYAHTHKRCLSCGTDENMSRRKYCTIDCRQKLRYSLNMRTGLLRALSTKYATFYFTTSLIFLDVLPYGSKSIFSFLFPRSPGLKPVDDFATLSNLLGRAWWAEKRRTNKRYIATQHVLEKAKNQNSGPHSLKPYEIVEPARMAKSLTFLKLARSDLNSPELQRIIKSAYRQQAKTHHPDQGGDAAVFLRVQQAYEQLMDWAENPTFTRRRGFPDKWFYEGSTNRWIQPAAIKITPR
ncbi:MAG: J domain-containing protein [Desulfobacterales bacterium]|nr:J domain-containing protein [Desulfobacterales bacterium]